MVRGPGPRRPRRLRPRHPGARTRRSPPASGIGDVGFHRVVWYRRTFDRSEAGDRRASASCCTSARSTTGAGLGQRPARRRRTRAGTRPFVADITSALSPRARKCVVVRAEDDPHDLTQPRGKQDWHERPHAIWYERTTGIWQPVWLEPVPGPTSSSCAGRPTSTEACFACGCASPVPSRPGCAWRSVLTLRGQVLADDVYPATADVVQRDVPLDGARIHHERRAYLWSPGPPQPRRRAGLARARRRGRRRGGSYCGLRSGGGLGTGTSCSTAGGTRCGWCSRRTTGRRRTSPRPTVRRCAARSSWSRSSASTAVRIHQKVEDPRFLGWCDRLGLLVWARDAQRPTSSARGRSGGSRSEWLEVLGRDASTPALVAWVPFNESWGVPNLENDPAQRARRAGAVPPHQGASTRPGPSSATTAGRTSSRDIIGVHDYSPSGEVLAAALRQRRGLPADAGAGAAVLPPHHAARARGRRAAAHRVRVRGHDVRRGPRGLLERLRRGRLRRGIAGAVPGARHALLSTAPSSPASATPSSPTPGRSATGCSRRTACRRPTRPRSRRSTGCPRPPCPGRRWRRSRSCTRRGEGSRGDLSLPGRPRLLRRPATS